MAVRWLAMMAAGFGVVASAAAGPDRPAQPQNPPPILMADDARKVKVTVSWPTRDGEEISVSGERAWRSPADRSRLGKNIDCFAALGGVRLEKGYGHPKGVFVRVGLIKRDPAALFFEDIAEGATVTIRLDGIAMNQPAVPRPKTGMMQLKYRMDDLEACELDGTNRNLLNTADPEDPLAAVVVEGTARFGALDGGQGHGSFETMVAADGTVSIVLRCPYELFRHIKDPYQRTTPGGFFEPTYVHVEMELLPRAVAEAEEKAAEPGAVPTGGEPGAGS